MPAGLLVVMMLLAPTRLHAQASEAFPRLNQWPLEVATSPAVEAGRVQLAELLEASGSDSAAVGPNYWLEGAAIGAVALGLPTLLLGFGLCEGDDCGSSVAITSLGAAAAGAFIGAMIGGGIEKPRRE